MPSPTKDEIIQSGIMAEEYKEAISHRRPYTQPTFEITSMRQGRATHLQSLRHLYPIPGPIPDTVVESTHQVPTRDGNSIVVKIYQPKTGPPEGGSPLVLMFHEGGFCMGDLTDEDMNCRLFCKELGTVCVNVEYRLAPEHPFPIGIHDCWDALQWSISNAETLKANPHRGLIVGGASAGGNISAALALLARDEKLTPPITGQYLCVPALLPEENVPERYRNEYKSRRENVDDPVLKGEDIGLLPGIYKPDPHSPLWDPFNHPSGHTGVAKAYFQIAGLDPLRDEAVLYERILREQGVETKFDLYDGYGHMFWTNYPELEASGRFVGDTLGGVRWLLER